MGYAETAREIREMMIRRASEHGGPFASSLGVVELIIALWEVFDFRSDRIVFDIGQQYQAYKILSGRKEKYFALGQRGGISRYPDITESPYDFFTTGHAGTSVSAAMGYAVHDPTRKSIALLGDGALTAGQIYEALNHAGDLRPGNLLVIINQNGWSIDKNVGALSDGRNLQSFVESLKFRYVGPVDGHDTDLLIRTLRGLRSEQEPTVLHVRTVKGKGCSYAEKDPSSFHHPFFPFDRETGKWAPMTEDWHQDGAWLLDSFGRKCAELARKYPEIYFTCPAYLFNGGLQVLAKAYPGKVIDTGISEQHCMTFSSALRLAGHRVIMSIGSFFLPRCYDQVFDLCIQKIPLVVFISFPGIRPSSCPTHQGTFDISYLRTIPNLALLHPKGIDELLEMLEYAMEADRPTFIHGSYEDCMEGDGDGTPLEHGKAAIEQEGDAVTVVPVGAMFKTVFEVAHSIDGLEIFNPRFLVPFDYDALIASVEKTGRLLIVEDGVRSGGVGEGILAVLKERGVDCRVKLMAIDDRFIPFGTPEELYRDSGLTAEKIEESLRALLG